MPWDIRAAHDGKVGCNTMENITVLIHVFRLAVFFMGWYK